MTSRCCPRNNNATAQAPCICEGGQRRRNKKGTPRNTLNTSEARDARKRGERRRGGTRKQGREMAQSTDGLINGWLNEEGTQHGGEKKDVWTGTGSAWQGRWLRQREGLRIPPVHSSATLNS